MSADRMRRRPEAVYFCDLGSGDLGPDLVAAAEEASSSGLHLAIAGLDDAAAAAERFRADRVDRIVVADARRALATTADRRWQEVWSPDLAEPFDAWLREHLWRIGIGPMLIVVAADKTESLPPWVAAGMQIVREGRPGSTLATLLRGTMEDRADGALPGVDESPGWCLEIGPDDDRPVPVQASLLTSSSGTLGVRGDLEDQVGADRFSLLAGAYGPGPDGLVRPLPGPSATALGAARSAPQPCRRVVDLHTGVLHREPVGEGLRTVRFASLARPGVFVLRGEDHQSGVEWPGPLAEPSVRLGVAAQHTYRADGPTARVAADAGGAEVTARARQRSWERPDRRRVERVVAIQACGGSADGDPERVLRQAATVGFDLLLDEHRRSWATRWDGADIEIVGDPVSQLAARYALFHLLSCAHTQGEAAVGARGLTGLAYAGHVFWDTDVFVLPALAATLPGAARAVLQYRINRLDTARESAAARGLPGARFPWESADSGRDVTPTSVRDLDDHILPIRTGEHEEHINSDIAWALHHYVDWTGDTEVMDAGGRDLVLDTARYWHGRVRRDNGDRGHLDGVIGPDEYHEVVDDNAYTNNLARWHLQWGAALARGEGDHDEASEFEATARALVDGFDADQGRHEQFAGFWELEPLLIGEVSTTPVAADVLLGRDRVRRTQVIKQPDVLMLHHLLPDSCPPGSLAADLDFYLPRTAHGSSLSPAICAALLARDGRPDEALDLFDIAARLDLDDLTNSASGGLHLAAMGGVWQAVVNGFAGIRVSHAGLTIDPHLPGRWEGVTVRVRYRGEPLRVTIDHHFVEVSSAAPVPVIVAGHRTMAPARVAYPVDVREDR